MYLNNPETANMLDSHKNILFYGELPDTSVHGSVHGISMSNKLNLDILTEWFAIDVITENNNLEDHAHIPLSKITGLIYSLYLIARFSLKKKYKYLYMTLSLSLFGSIKSLLVILTFKIINKAEIVIHIHRGDFIDYNRYFANRLIKKIVFKLSSKIIVLSASHKKEFSKKINDKIHILENSIDNVPCYGKKTFNSNKIVFIFISNYIIDKGILDILYAFTELVVSYPNVYLECYGSFSDSRLTSEIKSFQSQNISINGPIYDHYKFKKIFESDCLILPSWNEGQPIVLLEAMSQGTPIISTDVGMIREQLGDNYQYLAQPRNIDQLIYLMQLFINSGDKDIISDYLITRYQSLYSHILHKNKLNAIFN